MSVLVHPHNHLSGQPVASGWADRSPPEAPQQVPDCQPPPGGTDLSTPLGCPAGRICGYPATSGSLLGMAYPSRPVRDVLPQFNGTATVRQTPQQRADLRTFVAEQYTAGCSLRVLAELTGR